MPIRRATVLVVASALAEHPEIARLEIQGHYPDDPTCSARLSQKLADALRTALIAGGVDGIRRIAKGHGGEVPLVRPDTEEARRANRCIELATRPQP